jgi:hypothetical protein
MGNQKMQWNQADWQALYDERAGIIEFDGGMGRELAEAGAYRACLEEMLAQCPGISRAEAGRRLAAVGIYYLKT